jgi:hypothetical protein
MAKTFDSNTLALLEAAGLESRDLLVIRWPGNARGLWSDIYDASFDQYLGVTFTRAGSFVSISDISQNLSGEVQSFRIGFNPLDNAVVTQLTGFPIHQVKVTFARALYDPSTRALVTVLELFKGSIDRPEESIEGDQVSLTYTCVSRSKEMGRATLRTRSDQDQRRVASADEFYEFAAKAGDRFDWGRASPSGRSGAIQ